jgi:hypothetical protein
MEAVPSRVRFSSRWPIPIRWAWESVKPGYMKAALQIDEVDLGLAPVLRQRRGSADNAAILADHNGIDGRKVRVSGIDRAAGEDGQVSEPGPCLCRLWQIWPALQAASVRARARPAMRNI